MFKTMSPKNRTILIIAIIVIVVIVITFFVLRARNKKKKATDLLNQPPVNAVPDKSPTASAPASVIPKEDQPGAKTESKPQPRPLAPNGQNNPPPNNNQRPQGNQPPPPSMPQRNPPPRPTGQPQVTPENPVKPPAPPITTQFPEAAFGPE